MKNKIKSGLLLLSMLFLSGFAMAQFQNCIPLVSQPSANKNYVLTRTFKVAGITNDAEVIAGGYTICQENQTIQYFDGLGRLSQTVQIQASPLGNDIIQPVVYDNAGRERFKYLSYAEAGNNGSYRSNYLTAQNNFYNNQPIGTSIPITSTAFAETVFEVSPLNRTQEQGFPGNSWQIQQGHTVKTEYNNNNTLTSYGTNGFAVRLYNAIPVNILGREHERTLSGVGYYAANQLYLNITKDENWTIANGKAGTIEEYKDKEGKLVLKRTFNLVGGSIQVLSTYYVYDDLGNLSFVLPPGADPDGNSVPDQATLDNFCYQYRYDELKRLTEKKLPGKGWEALIYNTLDQIILTQDANQRNIGQWLFTKYDVFGRIVCTGLYTDSRNRINIQQNVIDSQSVLWETRVGADYNQASFPQSGGDPLTINYYDDYGFIGNSFGGPTGNQVSDTKVKTLLTGSKIKVLGTDKMLLTVNYYDNEGRVVQSKSQNHLNGTDVIDNAYSFAGQVVNSTHIHTSSALAGEELRIENRYQYDHIGRKIAVYEKINEDDEVLLSRVIYDEIGQLKENKLHNGMQNISFSYNERGWLKKAEADKFTEELKYTSTDLLDIPDAPSANYNGNISVQRYKGDHSGTQYFKYSYDKLDRLTNSVHSNGSLLNETILYDLMGNITSLERGSNGNPIIYTYQELNKSNRLDHVSGGLNGSFAYDLNGNMTSDGSKGGTLTLTYNYLNLPATVSGNVTANYTYDALGQKLKSIMSGKTRDYIEGIHYEDNSLLFITTETGKAVRVGNSRNYRYEHNLNDHLGNVRVSIDDQGNNVARVIQEDEYYAFGLLKPGGYLFGERNNYLYNGKELQEGLNQYDYGARFYDPVIGRWNVADPMMERMRRYSPYNYGFNNPIRFVDPDGMKPLDIWRFDTETKELTLVKETNDKFDTFINQDGKVITRTNDTEKDSQKNIDNYGGLTKAKNWFEDLGELGKALKSDEVSRSTMESRAEKNGYETTGLNRLEKMGERKVWSDRIGVVRDFLAGKAVPGESAFATAMDITEAPKTYSNLRGNSLHKDVQSVSDFIKKIPASVKGTYENMMYELKRGLNSYQNGNYRGL